VRINSANIPTQVNRNATASSPDAVDKKTGQQKVAQRDSYKNSAATSAPIIDAEYVEFYSPSTATFKQERQTLDSKIEQREDTDPTINTPTNNPRSKYQIQAHDAPPPGTYIDTFA